MGEEVRPKVQGVGVGVGGCSYLEGPIQDFVMGCHERAGCCYWAGRGSNPELHSSLLATHTCPHSTQEAKAGRSCVQKPARV